MLTKSDLKAIKKVVHDTALTKDDAKNFVTKDDLDTLVSKNVFNQFKDKVLILFDRVIGELKTIREEQIILSGNKDQIENHETRINKFEEVLEPNPVSL